jgi:outer membrane protein
VDEKQAEVEFGRAEVALLRAERALRAERLRLVEQLGGGVGETFTLASEFEVFEPTWTRDELLAQALANHPALRAQVAQERAAGASLRQARSQYFPSVSVSTGFSGNTLQARNTDGLIATREVSRQQSYQSCTQWQALGRQLGVTFPGGPSDCGAPTLSDQQKADILSANEVFPFDFTKNPLSVSLNVSIPVFSNGFGRERQVAQASAARKDAEHQLRAEELRVRTSVTEQYDGLMVAHRVVAIEARNREVAEERLNLARQRYALGAASILELLDAETSLSAAERDSLNAVYEFHQALVSLEAAAGRSLRPAAR